MSSWQAMRRLKFATRAKLRQARIWWNLPDLYCRNTPERLGAVFNAQTHLSIPERLLLYTLVRGLKPVRVLEIGSAVGGSAAIMAAAMEDNGQGQIVGLDPLRLIDTSRPEYFGRFTLLVHAAPDGLEEAHRQAGRSFDLVFYDGPNIHQQALLILQKVLPYVSDRAYIVVDNGMHYGVHQAVVDLANSEKALHDCGFLCATPGTYNDRVAYNGLRLLRVDRNAWSDPQPFIDAAYLNAERPAPKFDRAVLNHDIWWCKNVNACELCAQASEVRSNE